MAMNPQAMCDAIMAEYKKINDSTDWKNGARPGGTAYIDAFDKALTEYVEGNMEITYTWSAVNPAPSPDPVTSFKSTLKIADKKIGQPASPAAWGPLIAACFSKAVTQHPSGFSVAPGKLLTTAPLVIAPPPGEYPAPLLGVCTQIYTWLLACINPAPCSGSHGAYTGATAGMVIA